MTHSITAGSLAAGHRTDLAREAADRKRWKLARLDEASAAPTGGDLERKCPVEDASWSMRLLAALQARRPRRRMTITR